NISVFNQNRTERYSGCLGKTNCRRYTGIRHANYNIGFYRRLLPNLFTGTLTYFMYVDVLQQGIRSGKINIFECTDPVFAVLLYKKRFQACFILTGIYNLPRKDITYILCTHGIQSHRFRGSHERFFVYRTQNQWTDSVKVAESEEFITCHSYHGVGTFNLLHGCLYGTSQTQIQIFLDKPQDYF